MTWRGFVAEALAINAEIARENETRKRFRARANRWFWKMLGRERRLYPWEIWSP